MLTDLQTRMLEFERSWMGRRGAKNAAIRAEFGWFPVTYYRRLDELVGRLDAIRADPITVRQIVLIRDRRAALRRQRRLVA